MTQLDIPQLTEREARRLVEEIKAEAGVVVAKLLRLKNEGGWIALGYKSWPACYQEEFKDRSPSWISRQLAAAEVRRTLPQGNESLPERHARELAKLPEQDRAAALDEARERFDGNPTASQVAEVVAEKLGPQKTIGTPCPNCGCTEEGEDGECLECCDPKTPASSWSPADDAEEEEAVPALEKSGDFAKAEAFLDAVASGLGAEATVDGFAVLDSLYKKHGTAVMSEWLEMQAERILPNG